MLKKDYPSVKTSLRQKAALLVVGLFLFLTFIELGLRLGGFISLSLQRYNNKLALKQKGAYRIMCLGESTTAMGGKDSYPAQLEEILNQLNIGKNFSVINMGESNINTSYILAHLEENLAKYNPNMVITMMGVGDGSDIEYLQYISRGAKDNFLSSLRVYKLGRLLWLHIVAKFKESGLFKLKGDGQGSLLASAQGQTRKNDENSMFGDNPVPNVGKESLQKARMYFELGISHLNRYEYAQAEECLKKSIALNPVEPSVYIVSGHNYSMQGKNTDAEESYKKAIEINPECGRAYLELGHFYNVRAKFPQAEQALKKAAALNFNNEEAYSELGLCYTSQNKKTEAQQVFLKVIELNPRNLDAARKLINLYEQEGSVKLVDSLCKKLGVSIPAVNRRLTSANYQKLKEILDRRGIRLVCAQYPLVSIQDLKNMFDDSRGVIFVDNADVFRQALAQGNYDEYFIDRFAKNFGHCTPEGNRILAENIARVILKEYFNK